MSTVKQSDFSNMAYVPSDRQTGVQRKVFEARCLTLLVLEQRGAELDSQLLSDRAPSMCKGGTCRKSGSSVLAWMLALASASPTPVACADPTGCGILHTAWQRGDLRRRISVVLDFT